MCKSDPGSCTRTSNSVAGEAFASPKPRNRALRDSSEMVVGISGFGVECVGFGDQGFSSKALFHVLGMYGDYKGIHTEWSLLRILFG